MSNFELKLRIPLAWYSPDPMHATKSRFEVPNRRFKGIWNLIFSKQGSIWGQNFDLGSCMELVLGPLLSKYSHPSDPAFSGYVVTCQ